jgi:hypothetical protein
VRKLHYRRIEKVNGVWSALEMEMFDVRRKGRTVLKSDKLQYNVALKDELFTLQSLRRGE